MDEVLCLEHQKPCYLKTGTKEGPSFGKSFYICSVLQSKCQFVKPVELKPLKCPKHSEMTVELQAIQKHLKTNESRILVRCHHREEGKTWCGYYSKTNVSDPHPPDDNVLSFKSLIESQKDKTLNNSSKNPIPPERTKNSNFTQWRESPINKEQKHHEISLQKPAEQLKKNLYKKFSSSKESNGPDEEDDGQSLKSVCDSKINAEDDDVRRSHDLEEEKENKHETEKSFVEWRKPCDPGEDTTKAILNKEQVNETLLALPQNSLKKDLERQLEKQKKLVSSTKLSQLPDNGARLLANIKDLEKYLSDLKMKASDEDIKRDSGGDGDGDSDVEIVAFYPPKPKTKQHQVIKVFPPGSSGEKPIHKPTAPQGPQVIRVFPPGASGEKPIHKPTGPQADPPESVKSWIDRNYKIHKPYVPHNPDNLNPTQFWSMEDNLDLKDKKITNEHHQSNQQRTFYGGRMTVKRLQIVREAMKAVIDSLDKQLDTCPKQSDILDDPEGLKVNLMQHQKQALAWLIWRENQVPSGGILADDMGLGKTLTMISLILKQKQKSEETKSLENSKWFGKCKFPIKSCATLIISPASLIHQWNHEIKSRCRHKMLRVLIYHGPNREKDPHTLASHDVILTTYKIISTELGRKEDVKLADLPLGELEQQNEQTEDIKELPLLLKIVWNRIILDEAHDIRNHKSLSATAICRLKANTRWAVTGTPIQNKLLDMFSLIRFLRFSPFDEYKVWKKQVESNETLGKARLNTIIKTLMLRRTKTQTFEGKPLVEMTKKENSWKKLTLSKAERNLYDRIYKKTQSVVINYIQRHEDKEISDASSCGSSMQSNPFQGGAASQSNQSKSNPNPQSAQSGKDILMLLLRLRQCCCHPSLLKQKEENEEEKLDLDLEEQMKDLLLKEDSFAKNEGEEEEEGKSEEVGKEKKEDIFERSSKSSKISALLNEIKQIRENEKAKCVVVSEWTKMLSLVALHLKSLGLRYHLLQGDVPPHKRMEMVEDFNDNPKGAEIMLLSLKAGGVGLNLIGGSHLFLMDSHWNPALEEQTSDRIHRVGQKKDVKIHRFICENTIEEKIVALQNKKRNLAKDVLSGDGMSASRLGLNDLRMLFNV